MKKAFSEIFDNKSFLKLWLAQIFSMVSAYTLNFILIGRIFSTTHSTVAVTLFLFLYYLPTVLVSPFAGVFVDNVSKRKIFIFSNLCQALIVLAYLGLKEKIWPAYGIVFFYSLCDEFFNPAFWASLPAFVKKENLPLVNSLSLFTMQGSIVIGSLIGGLTLKFLKLINLSFPLVSLLLVLASLLAVSLPKKKFQGTKKIKLDFSSLTSLSRTLDLNGFWQQTKEGYGFIKKEPFVLLPILTLGGLQGLLVMSMIVLPSLAEMIKIQFADTSYLIIIPAVCGAVLGTVLVSQKGPKKIRKNIFISSGLHIMGGALLAVALLTLLSQYALPASVFLAFILGLALLFISIPLQTLIQEYTPFKIRGRVFSALNMAITIGSVIPLLITATLVDLFGLRWILILVGAAILGLAIFTQKRKALIISSASNQER